MGNDVWKLHDALYVALFWGLAAKCSAYFNACELSCHRITLWKRWGCYGNSYAELQPAMGTTGAGKVDVFFAGKLSGFTFLPLGTQQVSGFEAFLCLL